MEGCSDIIAKKRWHIWIINYVKSAKRVKMNIVGIIIYCLELFKAKEYNKTDR